MVGETNGFVQSASVNDVGGNSFWKEQAMNHSMKRREATEQQTKKDTRRFVDGVRMHRYVGIVLKFGRDELLRKFPDSLVSQVEFSRTALPVLRDSAA